MKYIKIAFRNLNRQKKRTFLLVGAIAFGIMIVTLVNGFTAGATQSIKDNFSHLLGGHIFIGGQEKRESDKVIRIIEDDTELRNVINGLGYNYDTMDRRSAFYGELIFSGESAFQNVFGINWDAEEELKERIVLKEGDLSVMMDDPRGIIISEQIVKQLDVVLGETLIIRMSTASGQQNVGEFNLRGIMIDPGILGSLAAYADIKHVNRLLDIKEDAFQRIGFSLPNLGMVDQEANRIYNALSEKITMAPRTEESNISINTKITYKEEKEEEWSGIRYTLSTINEGISGIAPLAGILNNIGMGILITLFLIIMVGISNTFRMIMYERTREIGTMRALGMQKNGVRKIFFYEAFFLALAGVLIGFLVSLLVMGGFSLINFGLESAVSLFLKNGHLMFRVLPVQFILNFFIIALLTLAAAFFPAKNAANLKPADALRKQY
jgi:putative ABC transport system permease protein